MATAPTPPTKFLALCQTIVVLCMAVSLVLGLVNIFFSEHDTKLVYSAIEDGMVQRTYTIYPVGSQWFGVLLVLMICCLAVMVYEYCVDQLEKAKDIADHYPQM